MQQTLVGNADYLTYARGKNIVQVFDTANKCEVINAKIDGEIKGIIPVGKNIEKVKHLVCDS